MDIKQSTETWLPCILVDDTDFKTPETGIAFGTPTVQYAKEGDGSLTTKTLDATNWDELGAGLYRIKFSTTELNTVGNFLFVVTSTGILPYYGQGQVFAKLIDDLQDLSQAQAEAACDAALVTVGFQSDSGADLKWLYRRFMNQLRLSAAGKWELWNDASDAVITTWDPITDRDGSAIILPVGAPARRPKGV